MQDLGIDWDGPVPIDDDSMVTVDDIESPLNETQTQILAALLSELDNDTSIEDSWYRQYLAAQAFVGNI